MLYAPDRQAPRLPVSFCAGRGAGFLLDFAVMHAKKGDYYVYAYLDPRNSEVFYYGKGKGARMNAHLFDRSDSAKAKRIAQIRKKTERDPWVRIIAKDLTEREAFLIEAAYLWNQRKSLDNIAGGHFRKKHFRPLNSLEHEVSGFEYRNNVYYCNVGEGETRTWADCRKYGFVSAGGRKPVWHDDMLKFRPGDIILAYIKGRGYVGVGRIKAQAKMARDVRIRGKKLLALKLTASGMGHHLNDKNRAEYVARVKWIKTVPKDEAKYFSKKKGLYAPQRVRASLEWQPKTIKFVAKQFGVDIAKLAD